MYSNNTTEQLTLSIDIEETSVPSGKKKLTFQLYTNRQMMMIPDLEGLIPVHHIARIIDEFVESIPYEVLSKTHVKNYSVWIHSKTLF